ncbi:unnamed protein product [Urochloa humidicola]
MVGTVLHSIDLLIQTSSTMVQFEGSQAIMLWRMSFLDDSRNAIVHQPEVQQAENPSARFVLPVHQFLLHYLHSFRCVFLYWNENFVL